MGKIALPKIEILDVEETRWVATNEDEHLFWPRVIWIDPGVVSGVAVMWFDPVALFSGAPIGRVVLARSEQYLAGPENGQNGQINRFLRLRNALAGEHGLATGCESFIVRQMNMSQEFLAPVRIRAGIEFKLSMTKTFDQVLLGTGTQLYTQSPSDAMNVFTDARLKELRMYTPGPDHIRDATRHCLLWIRKLSAKGQGFFEEAHGHDAAWFEAGKAHG